MPNGDASGWTFLSHPHTHDRFLYYPFLTNQVYHPIQYYMVWMVNCIFEEVIRFLFSNHVFLSLKIVT